MIIWMWYSDNSWFLSNPSVALRIYLTIPAASTSAKQFLHFELNENTLRTTMSPEGCLISHYSQ